MCAYAPLQHVKFSSNLTEFDPLLDEKTPPKYLKFGQIFPFFRPFFRPFWLPFAYLKKPSNSEKN